jgi:hypothetical protein
MQKKKGLFVLHEGIADTIFNSQVLEHVISMKSLGIDFDILSFNTFNKSWNQSNYNFESIKKKYPNLNIFLNKALNIYYPFSFLVNSIFLLRFLKNKKYDFIHARADYTAFLCILTKPIHKINVLWDCRGASVDELKDSLSRKNSLIKIFGRFFLVTFNTLASYVNSKSCDSAIFVSESLYKIFQKNIRHENYKIIPCPVSEKFFYFNSNLRSITRKEYNIKDNNKVYLYSGSMVAYQSLNEQYDFYKKLLINPQNIIFIITSEPDKAKLTFKDLKSKRLFILNATFENINSFYNLADFAILLRENKLLNKVASPTKFGEYCLSGLPVIMNDTVDQAKFVAKKIGNYISILDISSEKYDDENRVQISNKALNYYSRSILNDQYLELYKNM